MSVAFNSADDDSIAPREPSVPEADTGGSGRTLTASQHDFETHLTALTMLTEPDSVDSRPTITRLATAFQGGKSFLAALPSEIQTLDVELTSDETLALAVAHANASVAFRQAGRAKTAQHHEQHAVRLLADLPPAASTTGGHR